MSNEETKDTTELTDEQVASLLGLKEEPVEKEEESPNEESTEQEENTESKSKEEDLTEEDKEEDIITEDELDAIDIATEAEDNEEDTDEKTGEELDEKTLQLKRERDMLLEEKTYTSELSALPKEEKEILEKYVVKIINSKAYDKLLNTEEDPQKRALKVLKAAQIKAFDELQELKKKEKSDEEKSKKEVKKLAAGEDGSQADDTSYLTELEKRAANGDEEAIEKLKEEAIKHLF